jgi:hypothetical protein
MSSENFMGLCGSKPTRPDETKQEKPVQSKPFSNAKQALKEQDSTSKLIAWIKSQNAMKEGQPLASYLQFYAMTEKRIQIYRSGQKCGDDKEKGQEILAGWSRDILDQYSTLVFDLDGGKKLSDLVKPDAVETDAFQAPAEQAIQYVQAYLDSFPQ